jgi:HK97 family phage prohead protease
MTTELLSRDLELREVRQEKREVDFVCSTQTIDSYGSVIRGPFDLKRYKKNPVILFAHKSRDLPIGKAMNVRVENGQLLATVVVATAEANPLAENVWQSILQETLRGISIGFYAKTYKWEKHDDVEILVLEDIELLEMSITPVPSNPEAIAQMRQRAMEAARALPAPPKTPAADSPSQGTPAEQRGEQENTMTDAEIAALKTKNEAREAEVTEARKALDTERAAKAAVERDLAAERAAHAVEKTAHEATKKALTEERDAALVKEVDALVGDKLTAAERDDELEAARANLDNFRKRMAKRPSLGLRDGGSKLPTDTESATRAPAGDADDHDKLFSEFSKSLS